MHAITIAHSDEFARATVLARTLHAQHPDWPVTIVAIGEMPANTTPDDATQVVLAHTVAGPDVPALAARIRPEDLPSALRGSALRWGLEQDDNVLYLDCSLRVVGSLEEVAATLREHQIVATPYLSGKLPDDGRLPSEPEVLALGGLHAGFIGVRRGEVTDGLLTGWPVSALTQRRHSDHKPTHSPFQGWIDALPARAGRELAVLPSPAFLVGSWNMPPDVQSSNGTLVTAAGSLRLVDMSGFDPGRPHVFEEDQTRVRLSEAPALAALSAVHGRDLIEAGHERYAGLRRAYTRLSDGTPLDDRLRRLAAEAFRAGALDASPFTEPGAEQFMEWLNEPAKRGATAGLTRYHLAIWDDRPDLQTAYPHLDGPDAPGYAGWLCRYGPEQLPMPVKLLPPEPDHLGSDSASITDELPWGVNVAGFFRAELGLGEAARLVVAGLDAANVPALPVQGALIPPCRQGAEFTFSGTNDALFPINLICMNGDTIAPFAREAGTRFFDGRHSIALWWWELGTFPDGWRDAFEHLDEVWVASDQIYRAVAPSSPVPVVKIPLPVTVPKVVPFARVDLGLPEDDFVFLYMYDYHSTAARKNPVGHVEAFKRAFPEPGSGATLVLKCINAANLPEHHEEVLLAARGRPDVVIIDRYLEAAEKDALIDACDCYLSLHRSEGFGLTPAEAMYLGKPVIATRYGGTLEFMTPDNSYLVDYEQARVGDRAHPYPANAVWADPDLDQAAAYMRRVFEAPDEARERGRRAAADIRRTNSPQAAGAAMEQRLLAIYDHLQADADAGRRAPIGPVRLDVDALRRQVRSGPPVSGATSPKARAKRIARGAMSRLIQFQTSHQRQVDEGVADAIADLERGIRILAEGNGVAHTETLAGFRRTRRSLEDLRRGVDSLETYEEARMHLVRAVDQHLAEHRAPPYMSDEDALTTWREDGLGRVTGFDRPHAAAATRYRAFTDTFRGPEERVRELQEPYLALLEGHGPVLDAGCGRGEFLDLLAARGIEALGIDLDEGMVAHCRAKGHEHVVVADANTFLQERENGSLGAIFSAQVIEHMPYTELVAFIDLALAKLLPGGLFIAETVNPHAVHALKAFWVDPTHQHPVFPETALALCRIAGFQSGYVFHPGGRGDIDEDRYREPAYAVVVRTAQV